MPEGQGELCVTQCQEERFMMVKSLAQGLGAKYPGPDSAVEHQQSSLEMFFIFTR